MPFSALTISTNIGLSGARFIAPISGIGAGGIVTVIRGEARTGSVGLVVDKLPYGVTNITVRETNFDGFRDTDFVVYGVATLDERSTMLAALAKGQTDAQQRAAIAAGSTAFSGLQGVGLGYIPPAAGAVTVFYAVSGASLSSVIESNAISIVGVGTGVVLSMAGGSYSINGGAYTTAAGTVSDGDTVKVRLTTGSTNSATSSATLTVAGIPKVFSVTTVAVVVAPTLNALTVSATSGTVGTALSSTISGLTSGSSVALSGAGAAGLSISGAVITGTPTTAGAVNLVETLDGATNSPRTTSGVITIAAAPATTLPKIAAGITRVKGGGARSVLLAVGDSVTDGWGGAVVTGTAGGGAAKANFLRTNSWPAQLAALMNSAGVPTRADAYVSGFASGAAIAELNAAYPNMTAGTGWSFATNTSVGGLILTCANSSTAALTFTPLVAANTFDIIVTGFAGLDTASVTDASGTLATIDENDTTTGITGTGPSAVRRVRVTRATASLNPISIQRTGTRNGAIFIIAIIPFDSTSPRLEIVNMGWPGSTTANWRETTSAWSTKNILPLFNGYADGSTLELGANDANGSVSSTTYQNNLQAIANQLIATGDTQLIKCHAANPTTNSYNIPASYLTVNDAVQSATESAVTAINFNALSLVTADYYDSIHLSQQGYSKEAQAAFTALRAATGNAF